MSALYKMVARRWAEGEREGGRERGAGGRGETEQRRSWSWAGGVAGVLLHWVGVAPPLSEVAGGSSYK